MKVSLRAYVGMFLAATCAFVYFSYQKTANTTYLAQSPIVISQSLKGVHATRFDENGNIASELFMTSWQHRQGQTHSEMVHPHLTLYQPNGEHWDIKANEGQSLQTQIYGKIDTLTLSDNVVVTRRLEHPNTAWELKTKQMVVQPLQSLATTQEAVFIQGQDTSIEAKGMRANLKEHSIQLLNNVKSHYVANN